MLGIIQPVLRQLGIKLSASEPKGKIVKVFAELMMRCNTPSVNGRNTSASLSTATRNDHPAEMVRGKKMLKVESLVSNYPEVG